MTTNQIHSLPMIGAIEAGGTKMICALGRSWDEVRDCEKLVVPTTTPDETTSTVMDWFAAHHRATPLAAIGIGSFGPLDFSTTSIARTTPKDEWRGLNWREVVSTRLDNVAIGFDTDTNAAGIAEWHWGAARGCHVAAYVTVGTGIGGALLIDGTPIHGLLHPEFGHMFVPRHDGDSFAGCCRAHGACLEGLASGEAVQRRWHQSGGPFAPDHPAWKLESDYLALAMLNIIMITSAEIIVLGGGVMAVEGLHDEVTRKTRELLNGYIAQERVTSNIAAYLVRPGLGTASGVVGAFALGSRAAGPTR